MPDTPEEEAPAIENTDDLSIPASGDDVIEISRTDQSASVLMQHG
jgi:hypothetical protein